MRYLHNIIKSKQVKMTCIFKYLFISMIVILKKQCIYLIKKTLILQTFSYYNNLYLIQLPLDVFVTKLGISA